MSCIDEIARLRESEPFQALMSLKPTFNPYRVLGIPWRELSHSALLAYLLDPKQTHGLGRNFLDAFLETAVTSPTYTAGRDLAKIREGVARCSKTPQVKVSTELFSIDIVITFPESKLVIAVENKIWAAEQDRQIERYQGTLSKNYFGWTAIVIFLTPGGYMPSTAVSDHPNTPCVAVDWRTIGALIGQLAATTDEDVRRFLLATAKHIKEDIMGDDPRQPLVRELFSNPKTRAAAQAIAELRPSMKDCEQELKACLSEMVKAAEFEPEIWGNEKELGVTFGYPPVSILVHDRDFEEAPGVFMGVPRQDTMPSHRDAFVQLATKVGVLIDANFETFKIWNGWHRILAADQLESPGMHDPDAVFDDDYVRKVMSYAQSYFEALSPHLAKSGGEKITLRQ